MSEKETDPFSHTITDWNRSRGMSSRSELQVRPEIFYSDTEARRHVSFSWIIEIQAKLSERALLLLALPNNEVSRLFLDIDYGLGLCGDALSEKRHQRIGLDISESGCTVASTCDVDSSLGDVGQGLGLRHEVVEGVNNISVVQWVCNVDKSLHESR